MARPIWTGTLSFGLLNVPVSLMSGERSVDLHFRMLDSRSNTPVRYERVNAETGEEVPWKEIVKAFEYAKGSYVVLEPEDIKSAAADGREVVDVKAFVEADAIGPEYFEKPYYLVPGKKAEKGYVLLREVLKRTGKIGIARVVIRTREYLSAVMPRGDALVLMLMRYPQELVDADDYKIPEGAASEYRISPKEIQMAEQLIESMSDEWNPADYRDEFRDRLRKVIEKRMKSKGVVSADRKKMPSAGERHHQRGRFHGAAAEEPGQQQAHAGEKCGGKDHQDRAQIGIREVRRHAKKESPGEEGHKACDDPQDGLSTVSAIVHRGDCSRLTQRMVPNARLARYFLRSRRNLWQVHLLQAVFMLHLSAQGAADVDICRWTEGDLADGYRPAGPVGSLPAT